MKSSICSHQVNYVIYNPFHGGKVFFLYKLPAKEKNDF